VHEFRMLTGAVRGAAASVLWLAAALFVVLVVMGMWLTDGVMAFCAGEGLLLDPSTEDLRASFGSLWLSAFSLYEATTGGTSWGELAETLKPLAVWYRLAFHSCVVLCGLVFGGLTTAVLVESMMRMSRNNKEVTAKSLRTEKHEFVDSMEDEAVRDYFNALELNVDHIRTLFQLLDHEQKGSIDVKRLVSGCLYLEGKARAVDVVMLQYELGMVRGMVHSLGEYMGEHFDALSGRLQLSDAAGPRSFAAVSGVGGAGAASAAGVAQSGRH